MKYRTIVCDPPWPYKNPYGSGVATGQSANSTRDAWAVAPPIVGRMLTYPTLSLEKLAELPVNELADSTGARLFLWATNYFLPDAFGLAAKWGFRYRQTLVWDKRGGVPWVPHSASVAPNSAEFILVCTLGHPERLGRLPSAVLTAGVPKQHSRKPELFCDWIEQVSPGPYVELFARRHRLQWDVHGFDSANTATLESA